MDDKMILVVDDEEAIRELVVEMLIGEGYTVVSACNGEDALHIIEHATPSLILLDLNMTILDGWGFVKALVVRGVVVPTILVSAAGNLAKHAADLGAVAWIRKPFDIVHLLATVGRHYRTT